VYQSVVVFLAVLSLCFGAYAAVMRKRAERAAELVDAVVRRESDVLEAVRVLTAASRESTNAVLTALDRTLRVLEPSVDAVLIFVPEGEELQCVYAAGPRAEHFGKLRLRRDHTAWLPARAALCGHRVELRPDARPVIPTDRAAIAVPMIGGRGLAAVVYAATAHDRIAGSEPIVRAVAQAASPFALAAEREVDRRSATYDGLTGLYTPRAFRARLQEELAIVKLGGNGSLALWFVDTDHFKCVNDTRGHAAGDAVLQRMAGLLREHTVPDIDLPARNGGDEFCAIVRNVHKVGAIDRAHRFCQAVRSCDFGVELAITASIGVAAYPYDASDANALLEVADAAMYHSKRAGRDRVSFAVDGGSFAVFSSRAH
jgi:diguanylate cyclase (GGDEF)-like protein